MGNINKYSLITTIFNEAENIKIFLESYKNQTNHADEFIIVDGGSTDGTIEIIENFIKENKNLNIKLIVDESCSKKYVNGPIARGRNIAIKKSSYKYIVVTDAGCVLDNKWFEEITKPFEIKNVDVVAGWYEANITNKFQKIYAELFMPKLKDLNLDKFLPSSRSIAFKKDCWKKINGYPEKTLTAEDTIFDLNLKKIGCNFFFAKDAIVYWNCPKNYKEAFYKAYYYAKGDGANKLFFKKFLLRNFLLLFPINILLSKKRRKNFKLSYGVMLYYQLGYLKGLFE